MGRGKDTFVLSLPLFGVRQVTPAESRDPSRDLQNVVRKRQNGRVLRYFYTLFTLLLHPFSRFYGLPRPWLETPQSTGLAARVNQCTGPLKPPPTSTHSARTRKNSKKHQKHVKTHTFTYVYARLRTPSGPFCTFAPQAGKVPMFPAGERREQQGPSRVRRARKTHVKHTLNAPPFYVRLRRRLRHMSQTPASCSTKSASPHKHVKHT